MGKGQRRSMDGDLNCARHAMDALSGVHRYYLRMFDVAKRTKSHGSARHQIRGTKRFLHVVGGTALAIIDGACSNRSARDAGRDDAQWASGVQWKGSDNKGGD